MVLFQTKLRSPGKRWWPASGPHSHSWSGSALTKFEFRIMKGRKFCFIKIRLKFRSNSEKKKNLRFCSISYSFLYQEFLFLSVLLPQPELLAQNTRGHLEAWATVHTPPISSGECRNWHQGALLCLILQNPHKKKPLGGLGARSQLRIYLSCKHKNLSSSPSTQRVGGIQVWKCVPINPRMGETETSVIFLASQFTRVQM